MSTMASDPTPNVHQLLAFYLEAGVDCALAEEPVNRLADPDIAPAARETAPAQPARSAPTRSMPAPLPITRGAPPQETQICLPFIRRQIELVDPDVLVTLGNPSTQALLGTREGIMRSRGKWFDYDTGSRAIRALPTFHPAYLLRSPSYKRMSWQDLRAISKALENASH